MALVASAALATDVDDSPFSAAFAAGIVPLCFFPRGDNLLTAATFARRKIREEGGVVKRATLGISEFGVTTRDAT